MSAATVTQLKAAEANLIHAVGTATSAVESIGTDNLAAAMIRFADAVGAARQRLAQAVADFGELLEDAAVAVGWMADDINQDVDSLLAERDENEVRKDFTPSERVEIARQIAGAKGNQHGGSRRAGVQEEKIPLERIAEMAGFGNQKTMRQAESVVESGTPELVEAMDKGDVSISAVPAFSPDGGNPARAGGYDPDAIIELGQYDTEASTPGGPAVTVAANPPASHTSNGGHVGRNGKARKRR